MKTTLLVLLAAAIGCAGAAYADANSGKPAWKGTIGKGDTVYVRNINGQVRIVASSGNKVVVRADASGGAKVEVVPHAGGVTICGIPKANSYTCDKDGQLRVEGSTHGNSKINLEVAVPKGAVLDVSTVNGGVKIVGVGSTSRAATVNGDLDIETSGPVEGQTVNGSIDVQISKLTRKGDIDLETVNGSIHLDLPNKINADVKAKLVHGTISTKRKLTDSKQRRHKLTGRLGKGGRRVRLRTVNGSIDLE